jgi:hypothetical protein
MSLMLLVVIYTFGDNVGVGDMARFPLEKSPWYVYSKHLN